MKNAASLLLAVFLASCHGITEKAADSNRFKFIRGGPDRPDIVLDGMTGCVRIVEQMPERTMMLLEAERRKLIKPEHLTELRQLRSRGLAPGADDRVFSWRLVDAVSSAGDVSCSNSKQMAVGETRGTSDGFSIKRIN